MTLREWIDSYPEYVLDLIYQHKIDVSSDTFQKIQAAVIEKWERFHGKGYFIAFAYAAKSIGIKYFSPVWGKYFSSINDLNRYKRLLRRITGEDIKFVIYSSKGFEKGFEKYESEKKEN
jgi:hypothetical protein